MGKACQNQRNNPGLMRAKPQPGASSDSHPLLVALLEVSLSEVGSYIQGNSASRSKPSLRGHKKGLRQPPLFKDGQYPIRSRVQEHPKGHPKLNHDSESPKKTDTP